MPYQYFDYYYDDPGAASTAKSNIETHFPGVTVSIQSVSAGGKVYHGLIINTSGYEDPDEVEMLIGEILSYADTGGVYYSHQVYIGG